MNRPVRSKLSSKNLTLIGIPKRLQNITINSFDTENSPSLEEVRLFIERYINDIDLKFKRGEGILMRGSNGVGKTMLACIIAKEAYRHRYTARRVTFLDYINSYTRVWSAKDFNTKESLEEEFFKKYKSVEFLILEEVGKEIDSKVSAPILEDCLRYREDNSLPTIICTNSNIDVLAEKYGNSIMSLMRGNMIPITISTEDKRNVID